MTICFPLLLQVTQCYVPYLSGLQLFEHTPVRLVTERKSAACLVCPDSDKRLSKIPLVIVS